MHNFAARASKEVPYPPLPKTFMQSPGTIWARYKGIKKEFTKAPSLWFSK